MDDQAGDRGRFLIEQIPIHHAIEVADASDQSTHAYLARLRDELLDGEIFYTLREAQIIIESWRRHFNTIRPHESLGYKPPAPEVFVPPSPRGRLRYVDRLRRPRWRNGQLSTNIPPGPLDGGRSTQITTVQPYWKNTH